ncbi:MAG: glycosyltransferase [Fusobacterium sp. JB019]|nr:glycosyltransferase [Fusobacterium sp. JB019]
MKILMLDVYGRSVKRKKRYGAQKSMDELIKTLSVENNCVQIYLEDEISKIKFKQNRILFPISKKINVFGGKILRYNFFQKIKLALSILFFQIRLYFLLKIEKPDVFYCNDIRSFFMVFLATKLLKIKTITYIRVDIKNNFVSRNCLRNCDKIITISNGLLNDLDQNFVKKYKNKIKLIYTGFDFDTYDYSSKLDNLSKDKVRIGYVASINPRKGLDFLTDILENNQKIKDKYQLVIAGGVIPNYEEYWEKIENKLKSNNIDYVFLGFQKNIDKIYNSIDFLVLPSLSEGLPRSIIEGMSHSIPVIANNVGGTNQILESGINGFLIEVGDKVNWEEKIETLIFDKGLRISMGKKSREIVIEKFSITKYKKRVQEEF